MAKQVTDNDVEPVLAVPASKAMWLLIAVVTYLAYVTLGFDDRVDRIITNRGEKLYEIVDAEMDDIEDLYSEYLSLVLQNECSEVVKKYQDTVCKIETRKHKYADFNLLDSDGAHPNR